MKVDTRRCPGQDAEEGEEHHAEPGGCLGDWHDVAGWQGTLDDGQLKTWWVAKKDFGTGPFRWAVHLEKSGPLVASSESFFLPDGVGKTAKIEMSIEP